MRTRLAILAALAAAAPAWSADPAPVPYPDGYRDWRHVKSMTILPGHGLYEGLGGVHHVYANKAALAGYKSGRWADGSVFVVDFFVEKVADNTITEGDRKLIAVMRKDSRKYQQTGGWGWEGFKAGMRDQRAVGANAKTACFDCHTAQRGRDYVFSAPRD